MGLWGLTVVLIVVGYRPPKRHNRLDGLSLWQKLGRLDLPGMAMVREWSILKSYHELNQIPQLSVGLTLLLAGLSLGQNPWPWGSGRVVAPLGGGMCHACHIWRIRMEMYVARPCYKMTYSWLKALRSHKDWYPAS